MADSFITRVPSTASARDAEALFSRDEDDQLIVREKATRDRFKERVKLSIDGYEMEIERALPRTDFLGNEEMDTDGLPKPRSTTIYDAAKKLAEELIKKGEWDRAELGRRIPVLCHRDHLDPVAVCRICSVHVSKKRRRDGRIMPSPKLVPACQHEVQPDMVVTTRAGWGGFSPEEKAKLAKERAALEQLQATIPGDSDEKLPAWLKDARRLLRVNPKAERDELLGKATTLLKSLGPIEEDEEENRAEQRRSLEDLKSTSPADDDKNAFETWLGRARKALGVTAKDIVTDLSRKITGRLSAIAELEKAVLEYGEQTHTSICLLSELLLADHGPREADPEPRRFDNELVAVSRSLGVSHPREAFQRTPGAASSRNQHLHPNSRPISLDVLPNQSKGSFTPNPLFPYDSRSIHVDHDRCILCDRCVRSCSDVKPFKVIGHTGKGYQTRISFDLDQVMNESGCVQCGECMTACPTGALTFNRRVVPKPVWEALGISEPTDPRLAALADPAQPLPEEFLTTEQMLKVQLKYLDEGGTEREFAPFKGIPYAFLRWNEGAVRRRPFASGEVLCRQGEYGTTAYLLEEGAIEVWVGRDGTQKKPGLLARLFSSKAKTTAAGKLVDTLHAAKDLIAGEMACMTNSVRTATLVAAGDITVLEVTRNVLQMLQRAAGARDVLNRVYRRRAIDSCLRRGALFEGLTQEESGVIIRSLLNVAELRRLEPREVVVAQGDREGDFYIVRLGFVKVVITTGGHEQVLAQLGPNQYFGEIALLGYHPEVQAAARIAGFDPHIRTATCSALDDLEVVRIPGTAFRQLLQQHPAIEARMVQRCVAILKDRQNTTPPERPRLAEYLDQGLFQGQKTLVLDLLRCTRCDECTRACADAHGDGHSRLLREGLRFGNFLVAASCRSCHQPYCMDGCPVDAIHRDTKSLEVLIDNHCIGCSLCERNCPYGSIQMVPKQKGLRWQDLLDDVVGEPQLIASVERKAVNCDLCNGLVKPGQETFCVSACPHEAAFRWDGAKILEEVSRRDG